MCLLLYTYSCILFYFAKVKKREKEGKKTLTLDQFLATDDGFFEPKSKDRTIMPESPDGKQPITFLFVL